MQPLNKLFDRVRQRLGPAGGLSLYFACLFAGHGVTLPYLNPWMASRGVTVEQIALIASVTALVRMVAGPIAGFLADRLGAHRLVLIVMAWLWFAAWLLLAQSTVFAHFLTAQILIAITGAALMPLADTLSLAGMRAGLMDYGRVRLWGSVTFLIATLVGGVLIGRVGLDVVSWYVVAAALMTALSTILLPTLQLSQPGTARPRVADALALVATPLFKRFLLVAALAQSAHAVLYVYSTLHWQTQGISAAWCGLLWAIGVAAEIWLFWIGPRLPVWLTPLRLLVIGLLGGIVRWTIMGFDPPLAILVPLQVLHGATFAAAHLAAMQFISRAVPPAQAGTAQSINAVVSGGLGMALATQAAGNAYSSAGGRAYWVMALMSLAGLLLCLRLLRSWDGGTISVAGSPTAGRE